MLLVVLPFLVLVLISLELGGLVFHSLEAHVIILSFNCVKGLNILLSLIFLLFSDLLTGGDLSSLNSLDCLSSIKVSLLFLESVAGSSDEV